LQRRQNPTPPEQNEPSNNNKQYIWNVFRKKLGRAIKLVAVMSAHAVFAAAKKKSSPVEVKRFR